jgi:hypothetical protein
MEELLSQSLFHIPNPSAVGYSSTQPEKNNPHQSKLNLHAQKNPISAQVLGGSGLSPLRTSIATCFIAPPPPPPPPSLSVCLCLSTLCHGDDTHERKSHTAAAAAKIRASTPFAFMEFLLLPFAFCRKYDMQTAKTAEEKKKKKTRSRHSKLSRPYYFPGKENAAS